MARTVITMNITTWQWSYITQQAVVFGLWFWFLRVLYVEFRKGMRTEPRYSYFVTSSTSGATAVAIGTGGSGLPFPLPIMTAMGLSDTKFSQTILMMDAIGTDKIAPGIPQIVPQSRRESSITTGLSPNLSPTTLGVTKLPMENCMVVTKINTMIGWKYPGEN